MLEARHKVTDWLRHCHCHDGGLFAVLHTAWAALSSVPD